MISPVISRTVIEAIISCSCWKAGFNLAEHCGHYTSDFPMKNHECENFKNLIDLYPDISYSVLQKCVSYGNEKKTTKKFDFRLIENCSHSHVKDEKGKFIFFTFYKLINDCLEGKIT